MKRRKNVLAGIFIAVMLIFVLFMAAFTVQRARLDDQIEDTRRSLETSQGRERKQQYEYDEVIGQLPLVQAELEEMQPQADAASETVAELRVERKRLRAEKKTLEEDGLGNTDGTGQASDEKNSAQAEDESKDQQTDGEVRHE